MFACNSKTLHGIWVVFDILCLTMAGFFSKLIWILIWIKHTVILVMFLALLMGDDVCVLRYYLLGYSCFAFNAILTQ